MRGIMVVLMVIGGLLLAALIAGIVLSNLRFFIWIAIIGLIVWGVYMLVTRPGATADARDKTPTGHGSAGAEARRRGYSPRTTPSRRTQGERAMRARLSS